MYKHIIDSHAHIFPDKIARKATDGIGDFYSLKMRFDGSVNSLLEIGNEAGLDGYIVQSVGTTLHQVESINNFIHDTVTNNPTMFGFMTLHPDMENPEKEIDRGIKAGLKGIKLHPDFQHFHLGGKRCTRLLEANNNRLPVLVHTGDMRYDYSNPCLMKTVAEQFPNTRFIAAHFGGWSQWDEAKQCLYDKENVWVDSSSSFYEMNVSSAMEIINIYGIERVFFGTDYPMWSAVDELKFIESLPLSEEDKNKLLWKNINDFLQLGYK